MSGLSGEGPRGVLREGWSANVGDYAMAGGWACKGTVLVVGDAAGGVYAFEGTSGETRWQHPGIHDGGMLAMAVHPAGELVATSGQDGRILIWNAEDGQVVQTIDLGNGWIENVAWSSDGQSLAASLSRRVHVFDADGTEVWLSLIHISEPTRPY